MVELGDDRDQHQLDPLVQQCAHEVVVIDHPRGSTGSDRHRDHVPAEPIALFIKLAVAPFALLGVNLTHAHSHPGGAKVADSDRVEDGFNRSMHRHHSSPVGVAGAAAGHDVFPTATASATLKVDACASVSSPAAVRTARTRS